MPKEILNERGEIIGINQAIYNPDNNISNIGIGFATPINLVKEYLNAKDNGWFVYNLSESII